jgi:hypothetical protein
VSRIILSDNIGQEGEIYCVPCWRLESGDMMNAATSFEEVPSHQNPAASTFTTTSFETAFKEIP